jgi:hypothetical protein
VLASTLQKQGWQQLPSIAQIAWYLKHISGRNEEKDTI